MTVAEGRTPLPTTGSWTGRAWPLWNRHQPCPIYSFDKHKTCSECLKAYTDTLNYMNTTHAHLSGSFSDSNILHALTKSSGDKSCGQGTIKRNLCVWRAIWVWQERGHLWMWASPPSLLRGWQDNKPQLAPSCPHAPEKAGSERKRNGVSGTWNGKERGSWKWIYGHSNT